MPALHRGPGRPRREEDAETTRKSLRIPLPLWAVIVALAAQEGISTHAWMRKALASQAGMAEIPGKE